MNNEQFEELCSAYVLDALDSNEQLEFGTYLKTASDKEKEFYSQMLSCALQFPLSVDEENPSDKLKLQIMNTISNKKNNIISFRSILYAAAAIILTVFSFNYFSIEQIEQNHLLANGIMLISQESQLPKTFCHAAKNINLVSKSGQTESAKLIWCDYHQIAFLKVDRISDLSNDKSYQIWMSDDAGNSSSVGVLKAHHNIQNKVFNIRHILNLKPQADHQFSVTVEPLNGTQKSIGQPYLVSS